MTNWNVMRIKFINIKISYSEQKVFIMRWKTWVLLL